MTCIPRPEYPRPTLVRSDNWLNLNGKWAFAFDFGNSGRERKMWEAPAEAYTHEITVKQIGALGREYGVQVAHIDPETLQALVPEEGGLSIRSRVGVLEGLLTPLLLQAARSPGAAFRLTGVPGRLRLLPIAAAAAQ